MNKNIAAEDFKKLCIQTYELIVDEYKSVEDVESQYPKLVVMYEFFRLLRGESFSYLREPTPNFQKELYKMEDEIKQELDKVRKSLDPGSEKLQSHLKEMKKYLTLK